MEALTKIHQMRFYPRMRNIEVICFDRFHVESGGLVASSPLIDWSWKVAFQPYGWSGTESDPDRPQPYLPHAAAGSIGRLSRSTRAMWYPHVALPHVIALIAGLILFLLGVSGELDNMPL